MFNRKYMEIHLHSWCIFHCHVRFHGSKSTKFDKLGRNYQVLPSDLFGPFDLHLSDEKVVTTRSALVGGWTNPSEQYARQIGNHIPAPKNIGKSPMFTWNPRFRVENKKKSLKPPPSPYIWRFLCDCRLGRAFLGSISMGDWKCPWQRSPQESSSANSKKLKLSNDEKKRQLLGKVKTLFFMFFF